MIEAEKILLEELRLCQKNYDKNNLINLKEMLKNANFQEIDEMHYASSLFGEISEKLYRSARRDESLYALIKSLSTC